MKTERVLYVKYYVDGKLIADVNILYMCRFFVHQPENMNKHEDFILYNREEDC